MIFLLAAFLAAVDCGPATETYKGQYCTDPRTMRKHAAYTEWADAYSCTRHRCQPGGRNLAIYTVGCKRVEAPESAIECEEVVEDTNMQFPFCCTRLRCLVVVRGEVWTRVLGQPWETLPAAPWSHMYKMKKPPPVDGAFAPKTPDQGPIYELAESESDGGRDKVLRATKMKSTENPSDCNDAMPRAAAPSPDIVIALSTGSDPTEKSSEPLTRVEVGQSQAYRWSGLQSEDPSEGTRRGKERKRIHKEAARSNNFFEQDNEKERASPRERGGRERDRDRDEHMETDADELMTAGKAQDVASGEKYYANSYPVNPKAQHHQQSWTEIPQNQWNEHDPGIETDSNKDNPYNQQDFVPETKSESDPKPSHLQALVDAIGSRMRDIESVVQRMSEKVHQPADTAATEKRSTEDEVGHKRHKGDMKEFGRTKKPGTDEHYKRFSVRNRGSKYLHAADSSTEPPLYAEDTNMNGYFSDASNSVLRRNTGPKEPVQTYMAPVETRRKAGHASGDASEEKKRKNRHHKKKKGKHHKKHHNKKKFNRLSSAEVEKNLVSLEDSNAVGL